MLGLDRHHAVPTPFATTATVRINEKTSSTPPRFLDETDSATVRAFATRIPRTTRLYRSVSDRPSYRQMKKHQIWPQRILALLSGRKVATGVSLAVAAMTTTAFAAGAMTHWMLSI